MQATSVRTYEELNPKPGTGLENLARQVAQNSSISKTLKQKAVLPRYRQNWEKTLREAYANFRAEISKDLAFSRAGFMFRSL